MKRVQAERDRYAKRAAAAKEADEEAARKAEYLPATAKLRQEKKELAKREEILEKSAPVRRIPTPFRIKKVENIVQELEKPVGRVEPAVQNAEFGKICSGLSRQRLLEPSSSEEEEEERRLLGISPAVTSESESNSE